MTELDEDGSYERAATAVREAEAFLVCAGAGMGVDSGLPDFRGDEGFWRAYPPMRALGLSFVEMANPEWFDRDPELAWGFYGHRLHLYRETRPHPGFEILSRWVRSASRSGAVFTSNVDGHFQAAGFDPDRVLECHGSIHRLQCSEPCSDSVWTAENLEIDVDPETFRARGPLPRCPRCEAIARPNILLFGDGRWVPHPTAMQERRFNRWLQGLLGVRLVIVECGAGLNVPTVRWQSESVARGLDATLIRINPREPEGPAQTISLRSGAREALERLAAASAR